jgi:hypothetical protein
MQSVSERIAAEGNRFVRVIEDGKQLKWSRASVHGDQIPARNGVVSQGRRIP